jgi:hypothetical protein
VKSSAIDKDTIAKLKSSALQAKADGDMNKAKEYLIQLKVRFLSTLSND